MGSIVKPDSLKNRFSRDATPIASDDLIDAFACPQSFQSPRDLDASILACRPPPTNADRAHHIVAERMATSSYTADEIVRRGQEIYDREIRAQVETNHKEKLLVINVDGGPVTIAKLP